MSEKCEYTYADISNLDEYILELLPSMLEAFADKTTGFGDEFENIDAWKSMVRNIADKLRRASLKYNENLENTLLWKYKGHEISKKEYFEGLESIECERNKNLKEGFNLLLRYFRRLWF